MPPLHVGFVGWRKNVISLYFRLTDWRLTKSPCSTATDERPSIRWTPEITFLGSLLKREQDISSYYTFDHLDGDGMPFLSIFVSPTRIYITTCSTAAVKSTSIRSTQEVMFLETLLKREQDISSYYTFDQLEGDRMSFRSIFVPPTRISMTTSSTAAVTSTSIRSMLEFAFLKSVLKTKLQNTSNDPT